MIYADYHTHTTFSDGRNTPEEMVQAALAKGMEAIGFSDHSYCSFDPAPSMPLERIDDYKRTIQGLKEEYQGRIRILCGMEQDFYSDREAVGFDYRIGSVHYVQVDGNYVGVDHKSSLLHGIDAYFGGDIYAVTEAYWATIAQVVEKTNASIIGHLDLVRIFNRDGSLFDEEHPRYKKAAMDAIDNLLSTGIPFEINTGAVSRGYQDIPYPAPKLRDYIRSRSGKFVLSSDSHRAENLCFGFDELADWVNTSI